MVRKFFVGKALICTPYKQSRSYKHVQLVTPKYDPTGFIIWAEILLTSRGYILGAAMYFGAKMLLSGKIFLQNPIF